MFRHKKRFGQHFLRDQSILATIADYGCLREGDKCIEIGPGQGALTKALITTGASVMAIELDNRLKPTLDKLKNKHANFDFMMSDVLEVDFTSICPEQKFTVVSNLPYEISTPVIFKLAEYSEQIERVVLLLQKEVVSRMCAEVGSTSYGRLSVMTQYYFDVEAMIEVPPEAFSPPPKVDSQVVVCVPRVPEKISDMQAFSEFVKDVFLHKRKMLRQRFKAQLSEQDWLDLGIDPALRPQNLSRQDLIKMYTRIISK